jgi:hypothetical protein
MHLLSRERQFLTFKKIIVIIFPNLNSQLWSIHGVL